MLCTGRIGKVNDDIAYALKFERVGINRKIGVFFGVDIKTSDDFHILFICYDIADDAAHPAIAAGDLDAVYKDILCGSDGDVVCIVGHSPYLEQWTKAWTGLDIQFKTGSMALFDYDPFDSNGGTASLLMYMSPKAAKLIKK